MRFTRLPQWPVDIRSRRRPAERWRGPRRILTLDEQLEVRRAMNEARANRTRWRASADLAARYGVSRRTIWRYAESIPVPQGLETLRLHLHRWAQERDIRLTTDDMVTLLIVIARHRDTHPEGRERAA